MRADLESNFKLCRIVSVPFSRSQPTAIFWCIVVITKQRALASTCRWFSSPTALAISVSQFMSEVFNKNQPMSSLWHPLHSLVDLFFAFFIHLKSISFVSVASLRVHFQLWLSLSCSILVFVSVASLPVSIKFILSVYITALSSVSSVLVEFVNSISTNFVPVASLSTFSSCLLAYYGFVI